MTDPFQAEIRLGDVIISCRMMSDWKVELVNDNVNELYVEFKGPKESEWRP